MRNKFDSHRLSIDNNDVDDDVKTPNKRPFFDLVVAFIGAATCTRCNKLGDIEYLGCGTDATDIDLLMMTEHFSGFRGGGKWDCVFVVQRHPKTPTRPSRTKCLQYCQATVFQHRSLQRRIVCDCDSFCDFKIDEKKSLHCSLAGDRDVCDKNRGGMRYCDFGCFQVLRNRGPGARL